MMSGVRELSPQLEERARKELNEDPERTARDIQHLREWLRKQPHLVARTDDQFLLNFLRGSKFSLERAKEKIENYYTIRTALPELYSRRDPMSPEIQEVLNMGCSLPLGLDFDGRSVFLGRLLSYRPDNMKEINISKVTLMIIEILFMENDAFSICGQSVIVDLEGVTARIAAQYTPFLVKKIVMSIQECYPIRPKAIPIIRSPPVFQVVINITLSFLKEKLRKRVLIHSNMETLFESIPRSIMPKEYGGETGTVAEITAAWKAKVESYRDYFLEDEKYFADESKRPGKPKTFEDLFGVEGSFRKLTVD